MTSPRLLALAVVLLALAGPARAQTMPVFGEAGAWAATHVVVVNEAGVIDGHVEVQESWKGDLKPGEWITVPELAAFAPEAARRVSPGRAGDPARPAHVTGHRVVLFLAAEFVPGEGGRPGHTAWASSRNGMNGPVAWVEAGEVYGTNLYTSGRHLHPCGTTEAKVRAGVAEAVRVQGKLRAALAETEPGEVAVRVTPLFKTESGYLRWLLIDELAKAGPKALPALRDLLAGPPPFDECEPPVLAALAEAGGRAAAPDLLRVLRAETVWWAAVGPDVPSKRNAAAFSEFVDRVGFRRHALTTRAAIECLARVRAPEAQAAFADLHIAWLAPSLAEIGGFERECDAALAEAARGPAP